MDSLTHIASGALLGELILGKRLGRRAMLIGAAAQSLPDIDVVASFWLTPTDDLLVHRGITHSLFFMVVMSAVLGYTGHRTHRGHAVPLWKWMLFIGTEMTTHLFLDAFNNYGTGWFEPFSSVRVTFNTLFVADPLYSLPLLVCFVIMLFFHKAHPRRKALAATGLVISTLYLGYALMHKFEIDASVRKELARRHIPSDHYFTTPTAFNNWLWYVVAKDSAGFHIGFRSVFDRTDSISFRYFLQHAGYADPQRDDIKKLIRFSKNFFTVENRNDTLVFNDLRFGQVAGWTNPDGPFVFHYYLNHPEANLLIIQRGRVQGWNKKTVAEMMDRIKGKP